jgi:hypothetical protein
MHPLDFISQSPHLFIFNREANKTNFGGLLFIIYIVICLGIFLYYLLNYIENNKYEIQYTLNYNQTLYEDRHAILQNDSLNPTMYIDILLHNGRGKYFNETFIIADLNDLRNWKYSDYYYIKEKANNIHIGIFYFCHDINCTLKEEDLEDYHFLTLFYRSFLLSHQNDSIPIYQDEDIIQSYDLEFSMNLKMKQKLNWQVIKYKDKGGLFSKGKEYIGGSLKSGHILVEEPYQLKLPIDSYYYARVLFLYEIEIGLNVDYYDEYIRTKVSLLTVFSNSFSLWMSLYSGLTVIFDFVYAKNFNNYKIMQKILSKIDKGKPMEEIKIELNPDFNKSDKLIDNKIFEKNIIKDDYNTKDKLIENANENQYYPSVDDSLELPRLHFFDYIFNNFYCSKKCCCDNKKQMLITKSNNIVYKYFSVENLLYNQILFENMLKDYRWNNPRLKNIKNNDLIYQLECYQSENT